MEEGENMKKEEISVLNLNSGALSVLPRVFITLEAVKKIQCFTQLASGEINGLGIVEKKRNDFIITNAFILKQKVSRASAEIDPMALNQYVAECEDPSKLVLQWHSHGDGPVYFSRRDIATISGWLGDYIISLVVNKKGDYLCRLDLFKPFYIGLKVPLLVILPLEETLFSYCRKEIELKVEEAGKFSKLIRKILKKDSRIDNRKRKKEPAAIPLENFTFEEEEK